VDIDRRRIAAVRLPEALGYRYQGGKCEPPAAPPMALIAEADAMHGALMRRADALAGGTENSQEQSELEAIVDVLSAALPLR
jgi:hypothetical protein